MEKINNINDIINNQELVNSIADEITEIPEDSDVSYEVWAIGYNKNREAVGADLLIKTLNDPNEATKFADKLTITDIIDLDDDIHAGQEITETSVQSDIISVEIESVVSYDCDDPVNIGTIYRRDLWVDGEYGSEENAPCYEDEGEYSEVVPVNSKEYKLLKDGSLELDCEILKDYNKNDLVQIWFTDEDNLSTLTYKIISKTADNKYICEFEY